MTGLVTLVVGLAGVFLARRLLDRPSAPAGWTAAIVLGPAVSFGGLSLVYFYWRVGGLSVGSFRLLAWSLMIAALVVGVRTVLGPKEAAPPPAVTAQREPLVWALVLGAAILMAAALVLYARQLPHGRFDAFAIWTARARLLHLGDDLPTLFSLMSGAAHPDYPLLLPASLAAQFSMTGSLSAHIAQSTGALFSFMAAAAVGLGVIRLGGDRRWAVLAAALLLATPRFHYWGAAHCADVPLSYLWVVTVVALATLVEGDRPLAPPVLAGFLLGLLGWTKNEGLPLTALLAALFIVAALFRGRRSTLLPVFLGALPSWVAIALLRRVWQPMTDLHFFVGDLFVRLTELERWQTVAGAFADRLLPWKGLSHWGLVWLLAALVLACSSAYSTAWTQPLRNARWTLACCWLAWFGIFVGTPVDLDWHIETALDRLLLQLLPLTLTVAFAGLSVSSSSSRSSPDPGPG